MSRKFDLKFSDGRILGECMKKLLKFHNVDLIRLAELNRKADKMKKYVLGGKYVNLMF